MIIWWQGCPFQCPPPPPSFLLCRHHGSRSPLVCIVCSPTPITEGPAGSLWIELYMSRLLFICILLFHVIQKSQTLEGYRLSLCNYKEIPREKKGLEKNQSYCKVKEKMLFYKLLKILVILWRILPCLSNEVARQKTFILLLVHLV